MPAPASHYFDLEDSMRPPARSLHKQPSHALQVLGGVDAGSGCLRGDVDGNAVAVPERAQLLELLEPLQRCLRQGRKLPQETDAVAIDAHVPQGRRLLTACTPPSLTAGITRCGYGRTAEVQRSIARIQH